MVAKRSGNNNKIKKAITIADKVVLKATKSWGVLSFSDAMSPVKTFFFHFAVRESHNFCELDEKMNAALLFCTLSRAATQQNAD